MIFEIGNILIDKLNGLPFLDKYAGVVKTITIADPSAQGRNSIKKFPASCNLTLEECKSGNHYFDLCPDSSKKSVLFLKDRGARLVNRSGTISNWKVSYDLVCWLNLPLLGETTCSYSAFAIMGIIGKFPITPFNDGTVYQKINISAISQRTEDPYKEYSFEEKVTQYLMYPYDYFVLSIEVEFSIDQRCLKTPESKTPLNCL